MFRPLFGGSLAGGNPYQQFGSDSFTDTNDTSILAHTNDALVAWNLQSGLSVVTQALINNNRVYSKDINNTYYSNFIPNSADYEVYGKFYKFSAGTAGITARASVSANTYYCLRYDGIGWQINRVLNGVSAQIGNAYPDDAWADGTEREAVLWLSGNIIKAFINGVEVISTADFLITDAGRGGITLRTPSTTTTGIHLDTFRVNQPVLNPNVLNVRDDLNDTNGVILRLHSANTGQSWIRTQNDTPYSDASNPIFHNNNLVMVTNGQDWRLSNNLATNDYEILFEVTRVSSDVTAVVFIQGRMRGTVGGTRNSYGLRHSLNTNSWILSRYVNSVFEDNLATYADAGFVSGVTRRGRIVFKGTSIQVIIDDAIAINYTNTTALTGDTFGLASGTSGATNTTTTGLHVGRIALSGIVESGYNNLYDRFDAPDGTTLNNYRNSESGYLWYKKTTAPYNLPVIINKRLTNNVNNTHWRLGYEMQTPNYEVEGNFWVESRQGIYGISARNTLDNNFTNYIFRITDSQTWSLRKYVNSTETVLASFTQATTVGTNVKVKLRCDGSTITAYINNTPVIVVTDGEITGAGTAGYNCFFSYDAPAGYHLEDIKVRAL